MLRKILAPTVVAAMLAGSSVGAIHAQDVTDANSVVQACTVGDINADACTTAADRYIASLAGLPSSELDAKLTELIVGLASAADGLPRADCLVVGPPVIRQYAAQYSDPGLAVQAEDIANSICQGGPQTAAIAAPFSAG